ncbi:MAG: hypothetical protein ABIJ09_25915 [Pseudomonadota bacterium]
MQSALKTETKRVGASGQICVGKKYAGQEMRTEYLEDGTILLVPVVSVPVSQLWTLQSPHKEKIERALRWASENPPEESDLEALVKKAETTRKG